LGFDKWLANWVGFCRPRARVQAHRLSSVLAVHEGVPRAKPGSSLPISVVSAACIIKSGFGAGFSWAVLCPIRSELHLTRLFDSVFYAEGASSW